MRSFSHLSTSSFHLSSSTVSGWERDVDTAGTGTTPALVPGATSPPLPADACIWCFSFLLRKMHTCEQEWKVCPDTPHRFHCICAVRCSLKCPNWQNCEQNCSLYPETRWSSLPHLWHVLADPRKKNLPTFHPNDDPIGDVGDCAILLDLEFNAVLLIPCPYPQTISD